jgi:hypothetical protein
LELYLQGFSAFSKALQLFVFPSLFWFRLVRVRKTSRKKFAGWALADHPLKSASWISTCLILPEPARKRTSRRDAEAQRESNKGFSASPRLCVIEMTPGEDRMKTLLKKTRK